MSRWNREAALLGIPDLPDEAFKHVGDGKIKPQGGGGGGGHTTATTTSSTSNVPEYASGAFMDMIGRGAALAESPYQAYQGERVAQFTPLQQQAYGAAGSQQVSGQLGPATGLAGAASLQALGAGGYQPGQFNPMFAQGPNLQNFQMGPAQQVSSQSFLQPGAAGAYMSPYMQQVVDTQKREAARSSDIRGTQEAAQMTKAGAFGGARDAIMRAERERNLGTQLGDIQATGSQAAFQQAQQQFNAEQQARMQAQTANQQAGLTTGQANLQSLLGVQQLGTQYGMQAQLANQQALMDAQKSYEQSRQFGTTAGIQGAQTALQGANTLGQLGQQQFGQQMDITNLQNQLGTTQQQQVQKILDQQYADFQQQRDYPYQQIGFMSDLLRGAGSSTRSIYPQQQPSSLQTLAGLGSLAYGMGKKEGGVVKGYAAGGVTGLLSDEQLDQRAQNAPTPMGQMAAQQEAAERAQLRGAAALSSTPPMFAEEDEPPTEDELLQVIDMALAEGDVETAQEATDMLKHMRAAEDEGIAAVVPDEGGDIPPGGIAQMADGGVVAFQAGGAAGGSSGFMQDLGKLGRTGWDSQLARDWDARKRQVAEEDARKRAAEKTQRDYRSAVTEAKRKASFFNYMFGTPEREAEGLAELERLRAGGPEAVMPPTTPPTAGIASIPNVDMGKTPPVETANLLSRYPAPAADKRVTEEAPPKDAGGPGGITSLLSGRSGAAVPSMAGFGFDADKFEAQQRSAAGDIIAATRQQREGDLADFNKMVEARGLYGEAQEARLQERLGNMVNDKEKAKASALIQAGFAILAADPSKGGWAAIGAGGGAGFQAYKGDIKDIEAKREGILAKMDEIENLRRQERVADDEKRLGLQSSIRAAETEGAKMYYELGKDMGINVRMPIAKAVFEQSQETMRLNARIASSENIARESSKTSQSNLKYADLVRQHTAINTQLEKVRVNALKPYEQALSMAALSPNSPESQRQVAEINRKVDAVVQRYVQQSGAATTLAQLEGMMSNLAGTQDVGADGFGKDVRVKPVK